jgi:hypothetical protein
VAERAILQAHSLILTNLSGGFGRSLHAESEAIE